MKPKNLNSKQDNDQAVDLVVEILKFIDDYISSIPFVKVLLKRFPVDSYNYQVLLKAFKKLYPGEPPF